MNYCMGCGKQIHDSALNCPFCGAVQNKVVTVRNGYHWASIVAMVSGIIVFILVLAEPYWDRDAAIGGLVFAMFPLGFGLLSLKEGGQQGRWMGIVGVVVGSFTLLISWGGL